MKKTLLSLTMCLVLITCVQGQSIEQLKAKLNNCIHENEIPGAAVAVVSGDSVLFTSGFGYADVDKQLPVTENTHFWIGSISKSFTALGILKLVEDGKLDLNTRVTEVLPDVCIQNPWHETDPVRIVHLLEHTAGLCDGISSTFNWRHDPNIPLQEVVQLYGQIDVYHRPGSFYLYSNTGYLLAGLVIEKITRMNYEEFLKRELLIPLEMKTTTFDPTDTYSQSVLAQGYGVGMKEIPLLYAYQRSAAHTYSSVSEMVHYLMFYLDNGSYNGVQLLSPEYLKRMETPKTSLASRMGLLNGYGLGNEVAFRNQHKWRGHNGAGFGFYSDLWYNHDLDIGYVVLVNQFDMQTANNVRELRELIAEHLTEYIEPKFLPIQSVPQGQLKEYCGAYTIGYGAKDPLGLINYLHGMTEVQLSGDTLSLRQPLNGSEENIYPVSNGLFRKLNLPEPTVAFFSTPDGVRAMVHGRDYLEELSTWKYWLTIGYICWFMLVMLSTIVYAFIWMPFYICKKISKKMQPMQFVTGRVLPFIATAVLVVGFILIAKQEMYYLGKITFASISLYVSTWLFAILSLISLVNTIMSLKRPGKKLLRIFHMVIACTYTGMVLFLWYWGIIGLKLWI